MNDYESDVSISKLVFVAFFFNLIFFNMFNFREELLLFEPKSGSIRKN